MNIEIKFAKDKVLHHENELQTERVKNSPACTHFHKALLRKAKIDLARVLEKYPPRERDA